MNEGHLQKQAVSMLTADILEDWRNFIVGSVNDHVVRIGVLQGEFHWHHHQHSDEMFYVISGRLFIDLEDRTIELAPGEMCAVPKGVRHRTRSLERTVSLCFESRDNDVTGDQDSSV
jgi:mannose-6-phosphate isomerase-like protein (cupin superfamily)